MVFVGPCITLYFVSVQNLSIAQERYSSNLLVARFCAALFITAFEIHCRDIRHLWLTRLDYRPATDTYLLTYLLTAIWIHYCVSYICSLVRHFPVLHLQRPSHPLPFIDVVKTTLINRLDDRLFCCFVAYCDVQNGSTVCVTDTSSNTLLKNISVCTCISQSYGCNGSRPTWSTCN